MRERPGGGASARARTGEFEHQRGLDRPRGSACAGVVDDFDHHVVQQLAPPHGHAAVDGVSRGGGGRADCGEGDAQAAAVLGDGVQALWEGYGEGTGGMR